MKRKVIINPDVFKIPVAGQITITGRVSLIAEKDCTQRNIKKGDVIKRVSKAEYYSMPNPKTLVL